MSLAMIKHNAQSIIEVAHRFTALLKQRAYAEDKGDAQKLQELDAQLSILRSSFLKLVAHIEKLCKEEQA